MEIKINELGLSHPAVKCARYMCEQYYEYSTMLPACEAVIEKFPEFTAQQVMLMWIATNASAKHSAAMAMRDAIHSAEMFGIVRTEDDQIITGATTGAHGIVLVKE